MESENQTIVIKSKRDLNMEHAIAMFERAMNVEFARSTLVLPYTYTINRDGSSAQKQAARKQLGTMTVPILETMRDEFLEMGVRSFLLSKGLTLQQINTMLGDVNVQTKDGIDNIVIGDEERISKTT